MSNNGYDDDFVDYDEDFESDNELEAAPQIITEPDTSGGTTQTWCSLAANLPRIRGGQPPALTFTRSIFGGLTATVQQQQQQQQQFLGDTATYHISPAPPQLTDSQRKKASKSLRCSLQLQQQHKLSLSRQLDMLVLQPLSRYQQFCQGVGAFADARIGSSQTQQLGQDLQEQDTQTEEIETEHISCQVPDDTCTNTSGHNPFGTTGSSNSTTTAGNSSSIARAPGAKTAAAAARLLEQDAALAEFLEWAAAEIHFELQRAAAAASAASEGIRALAAQQEVQYRPCDLVSHAAALYAHSAGAAKTVTDQNAAAVFTGELHLKLDTLLKGRTVLGIATPATPADATAAAAAVSAACAAAANTSAHLLLSCCSPVAMSAEAALKEHGMPGLGCLCIWDLKAPQRQQQQQQGVARLDAAAASCGSTGAIVEVLVSEGRPTCCCWGTGAASCLVFAGMEEGGVCCWDISEPDSAHQHFQTGSTSNTIQQQQQQWWGHQPARRPSYSTELPVSPCSSDVYIAQQQQHVADNVYPEHAAAPPGIVAVAVLPQTSARSVGTTTGSTGSTFSSASGSVCQLLTLTAAGNVTLYSVMLGGCSGGLTVEAGAAVAAAADLGARLGSRVRLLKTFGGLPLGASAAKPHLHVKAHLQGAHTAAAGAAASQGSSNISRRSMNTNFCAAASALAVLPGRNQQFLVGSSGGRLLKGACLGTPAPPREHVSTDWQWLQGLKPHNCTAHVDTASVHDATFSSGCSCSSSGAVYGTVVSLCVHQSVPEAVLAGYSCGSVSVFSCNRSRPVLMWQQLRSAAVIAAKWIPTRPCQFVVLHADGCFLAFDLQCNKRGPQVMVQLVRPAAPDATRAAAAATASVVLPCCMQVALGTASSTAAQYSNDSSSSSSSSRDMRLRSTSSNRSLSCAAAGAAGGGSTAAAAAAAACKCVVAVGYDDGSSVLYQLSREWGQTAAAGQQQQDAVQQLQELLATYH